MSPEATPAGNAAERRDASSEKLRRLLRRDIDTIVSTALKKNPAERLQSVSALAEDVRRYSRHEPIGARPDSLAYRSGRFVQRNPVVVTLAALVVAALTAGVAGTLSQAQRATAQAARADEEARSASAQRDFALQQLARAEAINDLNSFVLSEGTKLGERVTVDELMTRAKSVVERQQGAGDDVRVELLLAIGYQYQTLDEHARARTVLTKTYELASTSADGATYAKAGCALASALGQVGQGERAEAAERTLRASRFESTMMDLRISVALATAYGYAGRARDAIAVYEAAHRHLVALGRKATRMAGGVLNNWGNGLIALGRPLHAERLLRQAVEIGSATEEAATLIRLNNLARTLRDLDRLSEAAHYAELAFAKAQQMGHEIAIDQSWFARASIYR